jgi:hypothetical protein
MCGGGCGVEGMREERGDLEEGVVRWGKKEGSVLLRVKWSEFYIFGVIFCFLCCKTVQLPDQKS